jgi:hypothetical protein
VLAGMGWEWNGKAPAFTPQTWVIKPLFLRKINKNNDEGGMCVCLGECVFLGNVCVLMGPIWMIVEAKCVNE